MLIENLESFLPYVYLLLFCSTRGRLLVDCETLSYLTWFRLNRQSFDVRA